MGNGLASACIYRERSSRYGKNIKQRSSYTPHHSIILTVSIKCFVFSIGISTGELGGAGGLNVRRVGPRRP